MAVFKAQAHMREFKQRLSLSLAGATMSDDLDADGFPILKITHAGENMFCKIEALDNAGRVDGLGLQQRSYSPHKAILIQEATASTSAIEARAKILAGLAKLGMRIEIQEGAGVKTAADYAAADALASLVVVIKSDEINPLTQSQ